MAMDNHNSCCCLQCLESKIYHCNLIVCCAAQEAGIPHHEYIDKKKTWFSHLYIAPRSLIWICWGVTHQVGESTLQI